MTTKPAYSFFIGIDPGLTGAVAAIDLSGSIVFIEDLPTIAQGGFIKRRIDPRKLSELISNAISTADLKSTSDRVSPFNFNTGESGTTNTNTSNTNTSQIDLNPSNRSLAAIEVVGHRAGQGALSGASLASSMAYCEGVLAGLGIDTLRLPPAIWKRAMGLIGSGKEGSVERARALVGLDLRHDQAEAVLLARFAWLNRDRALPEMVLSESAPKERRGQKKAPASKARAKGDSDELGAFVV